MWSPARAMYGAFTRVRRRVAAPVARQPFSRANRPLLECDTHELGAFVWRRLLPIVGTVPYPPDELMLMGAAVLWLRPGLIVEWGTNVGVSARVFHELAAHYRLQTEIHSVDLPEGIEHQEHPHGRHGVLVRGLPVRLHRGDGATVAVALLRERPEEQALVFIDGDHARASVLRDARAVFAAAPGAAVLFHDTFYQPDAGYNLGPREAVEELLPELGVGTQVLRAALGCPGMTLVIPPAAAR